MKEHYEGEAMEAASFEAESEIVDCETVEVGAMIQVVRQSGVEDSTARMLEDVFLPFLKQAEDWANQSKNIVVTDITQTREMKFARQARLGLRDIRLQADKRRKELKEDSIRYGKAVQGMYNIIDSVIAPAEKHCEEQEKFAEVQAAKEKAARLVARKEEIRPYVGYYDEDVDLSAFSDAQWIAYIAEAKRLLEEDERIAAEKEAKRLADEAELVRLKEENERIQRERDAEFERLAANRKAEEEKLALEKAERDRLEAERIAAQKKKDDEAESELRRIRDEAEATRLALVAEQARKDAEREAELYAMRKKQEEIECAVMEAERKNIEEEEARLLALKQAEAKPTVDKLNDLADALSTYDLPLFESSDWGRLVIDDVRTLLNKISKHIHLKTDAYTRG
jgi:hypothetical protein